MMIASRKLKLFKITRKYMENESWKKRKQKVLYQQQQKHIFESITFMYFVA